MLDDDCNDTACALKVFSKQDYLRLNYFTNMHRFLGKACAALYNTKFIMQHRFLQAPCRICVTSYLSLTCVPASVLPAALLHQGPASLPRSPQCHYRRVVLLSVCKPDHSDRSAHGTFSLWALWTFAKCVKLHGIGIGFTIWLSICCSKAVSNSPIDSPDLFGLKI